MALADHVTFHGHRNDSATCLRSLDALVMCSDHEGMPMTPLEAIACGTPVVAHDVGGLHDILEGGTGGLLTGDHSAQGYATATIQLLGWDKKTLIDRGRQKLAARFSAQANADRMVGLYRTLVPAHR
jgi:glycosyltransferase involved in cell wall biosynthesis